MGGASYSDTVYTARVSAAAASGADLFSHTDAIRSGTKRAGVHESLDPKRANKAGKIIREALDSDGTPNSRAVGVIFDGTGSMAGVPRTFVTKLPKLMASLVKKGFLPDPHILFGCVGDALSDRAPLQLGQFESGNAMDDALTNIYLEAGGGGSSEESYELALYFMARKTDIDCYNKRGQKGYLFILGDERPYPYVKANQVSAIIGDTIQEDIPVEQIIREVQEKYHLFWIMPGGTNHWHDTSVLDPMRKLLGQNYLLLEHPEDVCELIVSTIAVTEGYDLDDVGAALKDVGADSTSVGRASTALSVYASKAVTKAGTVTGALVESGTDAVERL